MTKTQNELNVSQAQWSIDEYCRKDNSKIRFSIISKQHIVMTVSVKYVFVYLLFKGEGVNLVKKAGNLSTPSAMYIIMQKVLIRKTGMKHSKTVKEKFHILVL